MCERARGGGGGGACVWEKGKQETVVQGCNQVTKSTLPLFSCPIFLSSFTPLWWGLYCVPQSLLILAYSSYCSYTTVGLVWSLILLCCRASDTLVREPICSGYIPFHSEASCQQLFQNAWLRGCQICRHVLKTWGNALMHNINRSHMKRSVRTACFQPRSDETK